MKEHLVVIGPDGSVRTLYTDMIDLRELGALDVQRASNVEWCDDERGGWTVQFPDGSYLCNLGHGFVKSERGNWRWLFASRDEALAAEVAYLNSRL